MKAFTYYVQTNRNLGRTMFAMIIVYINNDKITQTIFWQIFGHAAFIKQNVRWHSTIYMISIFTLVYLKDVATVQGSGYSF